MRLPFLLPVLPALLLAGCAGMKGSWPSLAPRAGELGPLAPVAGSVQPAPAEAPPPAPVQPLAGDVPARLAAVAATIENVAASAVPLQAALATARRAAAGTAPDAQAQIAVTIAESRLVDALAPLASAQSALDDIADAMQAAGANADPAAQAQLASLDARITALRVDQP
jgi:hypothetical protein